MCASDKSASLRCRALRAKPATEMSGSVPVEGSIRHTLGLEYYELAADNSATDSALEVTCSSIHGLLASDPRGVIGIVPLPATRADDLRIAVSIFDELRLDLAPAADDLGHYALPHNNRFGNSSLRS